MYDQEKLNAYWKETDRLRAIWYSNGWKGPGTIRGRDIEYPCGHGVWVGFGISNEHLNKCGQCEYISKFGKDYD